MAEWLTIAHRDRPDNYARVTRAAFEAVHRDRGFVIVGEPEAPAGDESDDTPDQEEEA